MLVIHIRVTAHQISPIGFGLSLYQSDFGIEDLNQTRGTNFLETKHPFLKITNTPAGRR